MAVSVTNTGSGATAASTTHTPSFGFTPTSGRLLVVGVVGPAGFTTFSNMGSSWTLIHDNTGGTRNMSALWAYKVAAGSDTFTIDTSGSTALQWAVTELSGITTTSPLDQAAENEANDSSATTSAASGTTASLSVSDGYAISFFAFDTGNGWNLNRSYTNSSTEHVFRDGGANPGLVLAGLQLSSSTGFSETVSTTDTGDDCYGSVAVFKQASSGNNYNQSISGSVTSSGVIARLINRTLAGTSTGSGSVNKQTSTTMASSITPSSDLAGSGSLAQSVSGSITVSGVLSNAATYVRSYASSITLSGGLVNAISKMLSGTIILTGNVYKGMSLLLSGTITALGNLTAFKFTPTIGERVNRGMRFLRRFIGRR